MSNEGSANGVQDDPVNALVGEGKKYKDVAALAASRIEADKFIEQLKAENAALRTVSEAKGNSVKQEDLEKFLAELRGEKLTPAPRQEPANNQSAVPPDLDKTLERILEAREQKQRTEAAFANVKQTFQKQFGEKADEAFAKSLADTGLSEDLVKALASRSPQAALAALGLNAQAKPGSLASSVSSEGYFGNTGNTRNWAYYRDFRKKVGEAEFYSAKNQQQLFKDRKELGDDFWR